MFLSLLICEHCSDGTMIRPTRDVGLVSAKVLSSQWWAFCQPQSHQQTRGLEEKALQEHSSLIYWLIQWNGQCNSFTIRQHVFHCAVFWLFSKEIEEVWIWIETESKRGWFPWEIFKEAVVEMSSEMNEHHSVGITQQTKGYQNKRKSSY